MSIAIPRAQIILDYESFFGNNPPDNRISLIKDVSKEHILYEIVALNHRLKSQYKTTTYTRFEAQIRELRYFTQVDNSLYNEYAAIVHKYYKNKNDYPIIFNRQACLFAIEEIVNTKELHTTDGFIMAKRAVWDAILKYLLAVNQATTMIREMEEKDNNPVFENLNSKLLGFNELFLGTNQIFVPYRGYQLMHYFESNTEFKEDIKGYFKETYGVTYEQFIFNILDIFIRHDSTEKEFDFFYLINNENEDLFDALSKRYPNKETLKLVSIKKSPFIKVGPLKYLIADNFFLLEKSCSQFLNDFWFDKVKNIKDNHGQNKYSINHYRGVFGYFFEFYVTEILKNTFTNYKYSTLLLFDQLMIRTISGDIEISDVYLRYGKRVIVGQVKSGSIYDNEKYGGDVDSFYKNDRSKFFNTFGVNQVLESIINVDKYMINLDSKFPKGHTYEIYPCIIVYDKAFQTPLISEVFNNRFQELIVEKNINIPKVRIRPLSLIHISDLEIMEESLLKKPKQIWDIFEYHYRDQRFVPPFYDSVLKILGIGNLPKRIMSLYKKLIDENVNLENVSNK